MASELAIKADIERLVSTYSLWAVGVTDDPDRLEAEHGSPPTWHSWNADSNDTANSIESHFVGKGMEGNPGSQFGRARYVYIFMGLQARLAGSENVRQAI